MSGRVYCPECGASHADPFDVLDGAQCGALISGDAWCKGRLTTEEVDAMWRECPAGCACPCHTDVEDPGEHTETCAWREP